MTDQLRQWLETAQIRPDGRLPPERELAVTLGLSRAELRKGLALLEAEGLLWRRVGKGTFVSAPAERRRPDASAMAERVSPPEAMQVRRVLEPEIAALAARTATGLQIARMKALCAEMRKAPAWPDYQRLDCEFHASIAAAAGNNLLAEIFDIVNEVRRRVVWGGLDKRSYGPPADYHSFDEHEAIVAAIESRDRAGAAEAMRNHLVATELDLMGK
ncbi:FCD domain-containing protein [Rhizobium tropici]|uniref:FadR/GntR family transcriptional regulator n=1 Tax=Rhizobium TaxID=379 RepID=UPI0011993390|nr:FCD domain-containing protein [Rhizobium tropici]NKJ39358.1 DNA-binding FadR family transcriptional regulator [Rhizobium sp. SG570]